MRSGKTTVMLLKGLAWAQQHPGICMLFCRWHESDTRAQIRARLKELWPERFLGHWNADESCYECTNGSKVYVRGLKPSEDAARYSKFTGLTLAVIYIDQPEEIPEDFYVAMKARLSQPGMPNAIWLTPNPPDEDHWISRAFPDDSELLRGDGHQYLRTTVYDNAANLSPDYIEDLERQYPPGHVLRLRWIEGRRGLSIVGQPVYANCFSRRLHVDERAQFNPDLPLLEAWDFGHHHPAVLWSQIGLGRWTVLAELMGQDEFLEGFAPSALTLRHQLFPTVREVQSCCDPAGGFASSHGISISAVDVLRQNNINPSWVNGANHPVNRDSAIQAIGQAFHRLRGGAPEVLIHPRCTEYIKGCEGGYVWSEQSRQSNALYPNTRRPKKDGRYDHLQNCLSADTEVLTARGWHVFSELSDADTLATVNLDTDALEFQHPLRLIDREHDGDMIHVGGKLDGLATPDHRMVLYPRHDLGDEIRIKSAGDMTRWDRVKVRATWSGDDADGAYVEPGGRRPGVWVDAEDWAEFLGWFVAEGYTTKAPRVPGSGYRVGVSQSHGPKRVILESLLDRLPWRWQSEPRDLTASSQQLWNILRPLGAVYDKYVPEWVKHASPRIIRRFLIGAILGDGHVATSGHRQYFTTSRRLADDMQELFIKCGASASITSKPGVPWHIDGRSGQSRGQYHLNEWSTRTAMMRRSDNTPLVTEQKYRGRVVCATVPNGTLVVRRNGRPFVTGNCAEYTWLSFGAVQVTTRDVERQKEADYWRRLRVAQADVDEYDVHRRVAASGRRGIL